MKNKFQTDVALITVTTTEFRAVMHFHDWKAKTFPNDNQIYDIATFERDGEQHTLVHAKAVTLKKPLKLQQRFFL